MNCSLPGSSVHGISQASILEWVAVSFLRVSSRPRNRIQVSCIADRFFTDWTMRGTLVGYLCLIISSKVAVSLSASLQSFQGQENPFKSLCIWLLAGFGFLLDFGKRLRSHQVGFHKGCSQHGSSLSSEWEMQVWERVCRRRKPVSFLYPILRRDVSLLLPSAVKSYRTTQLQSGRSQHNSWIPDDRDHSGPSEGLATTDSYRIVQQECLS